MIVGRVLGRILFALAFMALGAEIVRSLEAGAWTPLALGELWSRIDSDSLNLVQAGIQRNILPELWDPVLLTVLLWPGWLAPAVLASVLLLLFRKRGGRRLFARRND